MKCVLPVQVKDCPITKLALIPFEKEPDEIYRGFELQYIEGEPNGFGYRVIAYRNDQYVDVYDDITLNFIADETFDVAEKGLNQHIQTKFQNTCFINDHGLEQIGFRFTDIENREVMVSFKENTRRKSTALNLLAPIGLGSKHPASLPMFFLYEFDFIRVKNTQVICTIQGKEMKIDKFPFPMGGQFRYFARYSEQCEMFELMNTESQKLPIVETNDENIYQDGNVEYHFSEEGYLKTIYVHKRENQIGIVFEPELNLGQSMDGTFQIQPRKEMGLVEGTYQIKTEGQYVEMTLLPIKGWTPVPTSMISRFIFNKNSVFCKWSKNYRYEARIDLNKQEIQAKWMNQNQGK